MIFDKFTQRFELRFWDAVILIAQDDGILMKFVKQAKTMNRSRFASFVLLMLVWAAVGFSAGLVFGRLIDMYQIF